MNTKKRESEEWPAEYTDETGRRRSSFNHETHERHERRREEGDRRSCPRIARRDANGGEGIRKSSPRNTRNTRKGGRRREGAGGVARELREGTRTEEGEDSEEWPTEYTERGTRGGNRRNCPRSMPSLRRLFEERAWCNSPQSRRSRMRWHRGQRKPGGRAGRGVETLRPNRFSRRAKVSLGQRWRALARPRWRVARGRHRRCEPRCGPMQSILARVRPRRNRRYLF